MGTLTRLEIRFGNLSAGCAEYGLMWFSFWGQAHSRLEMWELLVAEGESRDGVIEERDGQARWNAG